MSALLAPGANEPANITVGQLTLLNQSLQKAQGERHWHQQNSIRLESDLKDAREALGRKQTEHDGKAAEAEDAKEKLATAEGSIAELKQRILDDTVLLEKTIKAKEDAEVEKERALEGMTNAAESNRMALESKEKVEKEVAELKARMEEETKRANTAEETMRQLGSENATLVEEKANLEEEVARKEDVIRKLQGQKRGGKRRKNNFST